MDSKIVLPDPQFGITRTLRPYADFEDQYNGQPAETPIMLSEAGDALDTQAGTDGYDARLVRGLSVPMGARVLLWVPSIYSTVGVGVIYPYIYTLSWRLRNLFDFRTAQKPYHHPRQSPGVAETLVGAGDRVLIPAASQSIIYNQAEVAAGPTVDVQTQNLHTEDVAFAGVPRINPINPNGADGVLQQGAMPSVASGAHTRPLWNLHEVQAAGDELLLSVSRDNNGQATPNWDFANDDLVFSNLYGRGLAPDGPYTDFGVYISVGVSP